MAVRGIKINIDAFIKDRYWRGWWWDRGCLYDHEYNGECESCQNGNWFYTAPDKTGMKFGEHLGEHELYAKNRVYMYSDQQPYIKKKKWPKQDSK